MEECKPIGVPFDPKVKLQRNANGNDESKGFPYQAVGSLMYAMLCTRPDLAYPISVLNQHTLVEISQNVTSQFTTTCDL